MDLYHGNLRAVDAQGKKIFVRSTIRSMWT